MPHLGARGSGRLGHPPFHPVRNKIPLPIYVNCHPCTTILCSLLSQNLLGHALGVDDKGTTAQYYPIYSTNSFITTSVRSTLQFIYTAPPSQVLLAGGIVTPPCKTLHCRNRFIIDGREHNFLSRRNPMPSPFRSLYFKPLRHKKRDKVS
jgi:hypothetical protein